MRATLDKLRGADGEPLFRMLWGYSADDLQNGAANQLVEGLNHDSLDHRVLAIWSLQDITGLPNYGYNPTDLAKVRVSRVNTWKDRLRQKKIVPKDPAAAARSKSAHGQSGSQVVSQIASRQPPCALSARGFMANAPLSRGAEKAKLGGVADLPIRCESMEWGPAKRVCRRQGQPLEYRAETVVAESQTEAKVWVS